MTRTAYFLVVVTVVSNIFHPYISMLILLKITISYSKTAFDSYSALSYLLYTEWCLLALCCQASSHERCKVLPLAAAHVALPASVTCESYRSTVPVSVLFLQYWQALLDLLSSFLYTKQLEKTIIRVEHWAITVFPVSLYHECFHWFVCFSTKRRMGLFWFDPLLH